MIHPRSVEPSLLRRLGLPVLAPIALAGVLVAGVTTIGPTALAGGSAVSYVQRAASGTTATQGTSTQVKVSSRGVAAGDALIVSVLLSSTSNQAGAVSVADVAGNTYTVDKDQNDGGAHDRALVLSAHGVTALAPGSVITVTYPSSYEFHGTVDEFAGVGAADQQAGASATSAAYSSGPTGTAGGELVFGAVGDESGSNPPTVASGWTGLPSLAIGHDYLGTGYQIAGGTSATFSGTVGGTWMAMAVSYTTTGLVTPPPTTTTTPSPTTPPTSTSVSIVPTSTLSSSTSTSSTSSPPTSTSSTTPGGGGGGAGADVGPIGTSVSGTAASSATITVGTGGVAAGDGIVVSVLLSSTHSGTVAASDSAGNTYSVDRTQNDGSGGDLVVILSAHNAKPLAPGASITVTFPASSERHVAAEEFSGLGTVDKSASAFATSASFASGAVGAGSGEVIVGAVGAENGTAAPTFGAGWHALQTLAVSSDYLGTAYQVAGSAGSFNATGSSGGTWMAVAVSYLVGGGSGTTTTSSSASTSSPTTTTTTSTTTTTATSTTSTTSSPTTTTSSSPATSTSSTTTTTTSTSSSQPTSTSSTTPSPTTTTSTTSTSSPTTSTSSTTSSPTTSSTSTSTSTSTSSSPTTSSTTSSPSTTTSSSPAAHSFVAYGGYMDTHHSGTTNPKPIPWQGSANTIFSGQSDTSSGGWDGSAVRVDNTSSATESITLTVDIGSHHYALWGTVTVPAGYSLVATQQGNASFDGSDTNPAGCYGCNPTLCQTAVSSTIPVVHINVDGILTDVPDVNQILNTKGVDSAGCPYTGTRKDESQVWTRF